MVHHLSLYFELPGENSKEPSAIHDIASHLFSFFFSLVSRRFSHSPVDSLLINLPVDLPSVKGEEDEEVRCGRTEIMANFGICQRGGFWWKFLDKRVTHRL